MSDVVSWVNVAVWLLMFFAVIYGESIGVRTDSSKVTLTFIALMVLMNLSMVYW